MNTTVYPSSVAARVNYIAQDKDGSVYGYENEPNALDGAWDVKDGLVSLLYKNQPNADWANSLKVMI